jgi:hypothetical protein
MDEAAEPDIQTRGEISVVRRVAIKSLQVWPDCRLPGR